MFGTPWERGQQSFFDLLIKTVLQERMGCMKRKFYAVIIFAMVMLGAANAFGAASRQLQDNPANPLNPP